MSANQPTKPETPATTTAPTTPAPKPTPTAIDVAKLAGVTLDAEQLSQLERDMQLKSPDEVLLPGGKTLKDVLAAQHASQREETKLARKEAKLPANSSTVMETKTIIATDEAGHILSVPQSPPPPTEEKPKPQG